MRSGFFWKVPGTDAHYVYTDVATQQFLEADFKTEPSMESLMSWDQVPAQDKIALLIIRAEEKEKAGGE